MDIFKPSGAKAGFGTIEIDQLPPAKSAIKTLSFTYPLKLISPSSHSDSSSVLIFFLTYGGGLVAGDSVSLSISLLSSSRLALVTQGSTKLFKAPSRDVVSKQTLDVTIPAGGALCLLPDPVQPFKESVYVQTQTFRIHPKLTSVCVLDWLSEGRTARDEHWDLWSWRGLNEFWSYRSDGNLKREERLLLRDSVILEASTEDTTRKEKHLRARMDGIGVFGTLMLRGPLFESLGSHFMEEFEAQPRIGGRDWSDPGQVPPQLSDRELKRAARAEREKIDGVLWTAASIRGFVVVKVTAPAVERARLWLRDMLRDEGSIERNFGEGALLCLK